MKIDCSNLKDGAKYTMCRKITQVIEFSVNGRTYRYRAYITLFYAIYITTYSREAIEIQFKKVWNFLLKKCNFHLI